MAAERPRRVAEQIQRLLSSRLIPSLRDPRMGFSTVTAVDVAHDLKSARVYVTAYDQDPERREGAVEALNGAAGHFRREIGKSLRLRYTPELRFFEDQSIERADRIERLIRTIHGEEGVNDESE